MKRAFLRFDVHHLIHPIWDSVNTGTNSGSYFYGYMLHIMVWGINTLCYYFKYVAGIINWESVLNMIFPALKSHLSGLIF